jgi:hypothetical protein
MATPASTALAPNPAQGSPWDEAILLLHPEAAEEFRLKKDDKLHVLAEVLAAANEKKDQMRDKQWKYTRSNGKTVVFRDIFDKIALRLNKFKDIGDTLTQVDPLHAGVPWAVIKFFLQVRHLYICRDNILIGITRPLWLIRRNWVSSSMESK